MRENGKMKISIGATAFTNTTLGSVANTWELWTAVVSGGERVKVYKNGVLSDDYASTVNLNSSESFHIGTQSPGSAAPFPGKIDDVRIYNFTKPE
jgi:hypothetical protein